MQGVCKVLHAVGNDSSANSGVSKFTTVSVLILRCTNQSVAILLVCFLISIITSSAFHQGIGPCCDGQTCCSVRSRRTHNQSIVLLTFATGRMLLDLANKLRYGLPLVIASSVIKLGNVSCGLVAHLYIFVSKLDLEGSLKKQNLHSW